jgi:hypothetical protein
LRVQAKFTLWNVARWNFALTAFQSDGYVNYYLLPLAREAGGAYGDAGTGKTTACRKHCKHNIDAIMITADPCCASTAV